jgi:GAF domain-containing protein
MVFLTPELRTLLVAETERARIAIDADFAAASYWDREAGVLRTLVNVGMLKRGEERFPQDEIYPLDTFPAMANLLRTGTPYLDPQDVSSAAVAAQQDYGTQAGVAIVAEGEVWGELWAARVVGGTRLGRVEVEQLTSVAERIGDAIAGYAGQPKR